MLILVISIASCTLNWGKTLLKINREEGKIKALHAQIFRFVHTATQNMFMSFDSHKHAF